MAWAHRSIRWLTALLIILVTLAAFLPTLHNQFVAWDDDRNFAGNPYYRGLGWTQVRWMWTSFYMGHYMPLTWMTLGVDYLLWGMNPLGYHLTNLLLHAANAGIFYFVVVWILRLALPLPPERDHALTFSAGLAALLFAVHPLRVESVAWVTERRDLLSGFFYLLTLLAFLRSCERSERSRWPYWLSVALFGCALLSKSMAVSLPAVLLILEVYPLRRLGGSIGWWTKPARRIYLEKVPFVVLAGVASAVAFKGQAVVHNMTPLTLLPMSHRLAVSAYGLAFYLLKTIVPSSLSPLYELPFTMNPGEMRFILSYAAVLALTAIALALRHRVPGMAAAWLAYVVCLLPVLGIFQNGPQIAADRYTYLAGLGWAILAGGGIVFCCRSSIRSGLVVGSLAMCIVAASAVLTWKQVQVWHDSESLWTYALSIDPNSSVARNNLGHELIRQSRLGDALRHFEQSPRTQQRKSADAEAHNNWGLALLGQGKPTSAIEQFQQALRIAPNLVAAHSNWGTALIQQGKPAEAIAHFQIALAIQPDLADTHINWGAALLQQGRAAEAIEHFRQAARIKPHDAPAHTNWGVALLQLGKRTEAIEHFQQALRIERDLAETR